MATNKLRVWVVVGSEYASTSTFVAGVYSTKVRAENEAARRRIAYNHDCGEGEPDFYYDVEEHTINERGA